jgi:parallel beta-helix repeat protein
LNGTRGTVVEGCKLTYNAPYGIYLNNSTECLLLDCVFEHLNAEIGDSKGIYLYNSRQNLIHNCTCELIYGDGIGLYEGSDDNVIMECVLQWNIDGIDIQSSDGNTIENCVTESNLNGILIGDSDGTMVINSSCNKNSYGILLQLADDSVISFNICERNDYAGIYLSSSNSNLLTSNLLENNTLGLTHGMFLDDNCSLNTIHHNGFLNNNMGNVQAIDNGQGNTWDNGEIGNYWSDWQGPDEDGDGIVDLPYEIGGIGEAIDNFPVTDGRSLDNVGFDDDGGDDDNDGDDNDISRFFFPVLFAILAVLVIALLIYKRFRGKRKEGEEVVLRHI